jgi:hypothetical protein
MDHELSEEDVKRYHDMIFERRFVRHMGIKLPGWVCMTGSCRGESKVFTGTGWILETQTTAVQSQEVLVRGGMCLGDDMRLYICDGKRWHRVPSRMDVDFQQTWDAAVVAWKESRHLSKRMPTYGCKRWAKREYRSEQNRRKNVKNRLLRLKKLPRET